MKCKLCEEKEIRIEAILRGYRADKKYLRKVIKILGITCIILFAELILTLAYGKDGILLSIDIIKNIIK